MIIIKENSPLKEVKVGVGYGVWNEVETIVRTAFCNLVRGKTLDQIPPDQAIANVMAQIIGALSQITDSFEGRGQNKITAGIPYKGSTADLLPNPQYDKNIHLIAGLLKSTYEKLGTFVR
jgi:hypothetical protein